MRLTLNTSRQAEKYAWSLWGSESNRRFDSQRGQAHFLTCQKLIQTHSKTTIKYHFHLRTQHQDILKIMNVIKSMENLIFCVWFNI